MSTSDHKSVLLAAVCAAGVLGLSTTLPASGGQGSVSATDWPRWRGPMDTGVAPGGDPPTRFGPERSVAWKAELPGRGFSSPIVVDGMVIVTTAVPLEERRRRRGGRRWRRVGPHRFEVLAFGSEDGELLWRRAVAETTPHERHHPASSSFANQSPVSDGRRIYAFFGSRGLHALELDGTPVWSHDFDVEMQTFNEFGESSSPALHEGTVVVVFDHEGESFIEALDTATGETQWHRRRDEETSWSSPLIIEANGTVQVVTVAGRRIIAYALSTGEELWSLAGTMTPHPIPTPVFGGGLLFAASGTTERRVRAIRPGGEYREAETVWKLDRAAPYNPSLLLWGDELYMVRDGGLHAGSSRLSALEARTGEPLYLEHRLPVAATIKASPVGASDRIYLATEEGDVIVVRRGADPEVLAVNDLGERFVASPAIVGPDLYLRGDRNLFCVREAR